MKRHSPTLRSGLTLLEVAVSLFIFVAFLASITQLLNICAMNAVETQNVNRATRLLQSQMNRVVSGEISLSGQGETPFDGDDQDFSWSMDCEQDGSAQNLWHVTVTVHHAAGAGGQAQSWTLSQLILDPAARGVIEAPATPSTSSSSGMSTGSGSSTGGGP